MCFSLMDQLSGGFQTLSLSVLLMGVSVMISSESESCCLLNAGGGGCQALGGGALLARTLSESL